MQLAGVTAHDSVKKLGRYSKAVYTITKFGV